MLSNFLVVATQTSTLFIIIIVGFILGKINFMSENGTSELASIVVNVTSPLMIISSLQMDKDPDTVRFLAIGFAVVFVCYIVYALIPMLFFRKETDDRRVVFRYSCTYSNVGFFGLPLIASIFGTEGTFYTMLPLAAFNLFAYTHGVFTMGGKDKISVSTLLKSPGLIGVAIGFFLYLAAIRLPSFLSSSISLLGNATVPLSMLVIGSQMSRANIISALKTKQLYFASVLKLLMLPAVTSIILFPFRAHAVFYATCVIVAATPSASFTSIFAGLYNRDEVLGAELVTLSAVLSMLTLPVVAAIAKFIAGL